MIYLNPMKLSESERRGLREIMETRKAPVCPGCGKNMRLCMDFDTLHTGEYSASFLCPCGTWMTQTVHSTSALVCANTAYIRAVHRTSSNESGHMPLADRNRQKRSGLAAR
ncbi:MAG: hypothetical protein IJ242_07400 [Clostridia bacterium]|nr:hypothetical protein [Clostridia bacterium]